MATLERESRYRGCLLGLATGDALGASIEFMRPGTFAPLTDLRGGGPFHLKPGEWTDDTSMALCLAESLIVCIGMNPTDQMERYLRWFREGYLSVKDHCFDIGNATRAALVRFEKTHDPFSGSTDPRSAGNGSLMRLAPVPMLYANSPEKGIEFCAESSRVTHGATTAVDACRYYGALIMAALNGTPKDVLLSPEFAVSGAFQRETPLCAEIAEVASGSFRERKPPQITGSGFVVRSIEAALWAFAHTEDFAEGCLKVANLGDDSDTTAAIYGQLAGAFYGLDAIPVHWCEQIAMRDLIEDFALKLLSLSEIKRSESK